MNTNSKHYNEYFSYIHYKVEPCTKTKKAVFNIIKDILSRKGINDEFRRIKPNILDKIIDEWIVQINSAMEIENKVE